MRHPTFRRVIALAIVVGQLLAVMAFHVPAAHAMSSMASHHTASSHPCHDNPSDDTGDKHSNDMGSCKSGLCKCPCVQLPSLSVFVTPNISTVPHPPMTLFYSVPALVERAAKPFRPPD